MGHANPARSGPGTRLIAVALGAGPQAGLDRNRQVRERVRAARRAVLTPPRPQSPPSPLCCSTCRRMPLADGARRPARARRNWMLVVLSAGAGAASRGRRRPRTARRSARSGRRPASPWPRWPAPAAAAGRAPPCMPRRRVPTGGCGPGRPPAATPVRDQRSWHRAQAPSGDSCADQLVCFQSA